VLHAARWKCRTQKIAKKSPSAHHRTTLSGYIFATKARIDNRKKNLLSSNISSRCPHNMVKFGLLAAGAPQLISTAFASWQRYCTQSSTERQPNFAALNRRSHLCSAGRSSRWALTHILVLHVFLWLKSNSITLAGSKLVRSWSQIGSKPNSITLSGLKLVAGRVEAGR